MNELAKTFANPLLLNHSGDGVQVRPDDCGYKKSLLGVPVNISYPRVAANGSRVVSDTCVVEGKGFFSIPHLYKTNLERTPDGKFVCHADCPWIK
ncbi:MAG TPA: hypothetical protein VI819_05700 [Patescibacteria group bacterium]|nr:hypothetical protein [Patescibacteria group bacterium]